jgi:hypothetical protein
MLVFKQVNVNHRSRFNRNLMFIIKANFTQIRNWIHVVNFTDHRNLLLALQPREERWFFKIIFVLLGFDL